MGMFEVQGVVSSETGLPLVQFRQFDENNVVEAQFQVSPDDAREIAQNILEAATNAIYDAALITWVRETFPEDQQDAGPAMVSMIRKFRADKWGLPDQPKDWRDE